MIGISEVVGSVRLIIVLSTMVIEIVAMFIWMIRHISEDFAEATNSFPGFKFDVLHVCWRNIFCSEKTMINVMLAIFAIYAVIELSGFLFDAYLAWLSQKELEIPAVVDIKANAMTFGTGGLRNKKAWLKIDCGTYYLYSFIYNSTYTDGAYIPSIVAPQMVQNWNTKYPQYTLKQRMDSSVKFVDYLSDPSIDSSKQVTAEMFVSKALDETLTVTAKYLSSVFNVNGADPENVLRKYVLECMMTKGFPIYRTEK